MITLPLADPSADLATTGGKGSSLATLVRAGLPVPPGFHITTVAYRTYVALHHLQEKILATDEQGVAELFAAHPVPEEIAGPIREAYARLGSPAVAVRSSATAEDLPEASFAGQQDTILDVRGADAVLDAVRRCWASLWTDRAVAYRQREGIDPSEVALAVVVQELVDADAAGVLFTADPVSAAPDRMILNATWGLGEALVSGAVTPDELVLDAATGAVRERHTGDKATMTVRGDGGTHEEPVPDGQRTAQVLDDAAAAELADLGRRIAAHYGRPMDVEWAWAHGAFAIVQARPITGLRDIWNDSLAVDHLWTNTNVGEAVPDVMTPCTWSLVQIFMEHAMATATLPSARGYGIVGGRFYLDLSLSSSIAALVGVSEKRFRTLTEPSFGRLPDGIAIPHVHVPRGQLLRELLPRVWRTLRTVRPMARRLPALVADNPARCADLTRRIGTAGTAELSSMWTGELRPLLVDVSDMLSAAGRSDPVALLTVQKRLVKLVGEADATALTTGLTIDGDILASLGPLVGLALVERGEIDEAEYVRRYGHRSPHEFEVSLPRPVDRRGWVDEQIAALQAAGRDPLTLLERQEDANRMAWARLLRDHPRQVRRTRKRVERWARAERGREQARSEVIRVFGVLRAFALRAGELTELGDEIFMLTVDEIVAVLDGATVPETTSRRAAYERYRALPPYPSIIRGRFDPFAWAADPHRRADVFAADRVTHAATDGVVTGFPGAAGLVEGTARVLGSVEEAGALEPGEILVTTVTNIGWTPVFPRAAAVVTDVGAPLSHAAIVARELGIPAVVGCGDATIRLHTGDRLRVDGTRGTVEVIS